MWARGGTYLRYLRERAGYLVSSHLALCASGLVLLLGALSLAVCLLPRVVRPDARAEGQLYQLQP